MKRLPHQFLIPAAIGSGLIAVTVYYLVYRRRRQKPWIQVGILSDIYIHPIKSCKAISVQEAECLSLCLKNGPYFDRRFVITDPEGGNFLTARVKPKMVLIEAQLDGHDDNKDTCLTLTAPGMDPIRTELNGVIDAGKVIRVKMYCDSLIDAFDCGDQIANWLVKYLDDSDDGAAVIKNNRYRLMYHTPDLFNARSLDIYENIRVYHVYGKRKDVAAFAELTPYMLMAESSMQDLNQRVPAGEQFSLRNFRPNLVVAGSEPYDEDNWASVRIGDQTSFTNVRTCTRCILTTVNWVTGQKHPKSQPLRTLASYRRCKDPEEKKLLGDSPKLGIHLALDCTGTVRVGDPVYVQYK